MGLTIFADADLSEVKGLHNVVHVRPSYISIDTIYRSHGKIPPVFLRGAGVPDNFIEYMGSLTGKALEFYSCFISYSTKDHEFANRLYADLQNEGVRCWFAPHDIRAGKKIHEQIDEAIRVHEKLLLILSPDSMNSEWVKTEIRKARRRERTEKKRVLFPVRLVSFEAIRDWELFDADEGTNLAVEIRILHPRFQRLEAPRCIFGRTQELASRSENGTAEDCVSFRPVRCRAALVPNWEKENTQWNISWFPFVDRGTRPD